MPIVRVPDGRLVNFPDDMPNQEIKGIIQKKFPNAFLTPFPNGAFSAGSPFSLFAAIRSAKSFKNSE